MKSPSPVKGVVGFYIILICYLCTLGVTEHTGRIINKFVNFEPPTAIEADGFTVTATPQSWTATNTHDFGLETTVITISGSPVTTAQTQYAQVLETTVTSDGGTAVATNLAISPKMLDVLRQTAAQAISTCNAKSKRSTCTLSQIGEQELRMTLTAVADGQKIALGVDTIAMLIGTFLLGEAADLYLDPKNNAAQYLEPVTVALPDSAPASSSTASGGPAVTAWILDPYPELDSFFHIDLEPTGSIPDGVQSTSLFCSATATPSPTIAVDRIPATDYSKTFCHDITGTTFGLGQPYNGTQEQFDGKFGYYTKWATTDPCKDKTISYTVNETLCTEYMLDIIGYCDRPAPDNGEAKYGGTVTDGCMIFEFQPYQMATPAPAPAPAPSASPTTEAKPTEPCPTVSEFHCLKTTSSTL
ncbi:hypothetical protein ACLMJK_004678 [Lecanora helva]